MIVIEGGSPLHGRIQVSGSKNESLALMGLAVCTDDTVEIHNIPQIADIERMICVVRQTGRRVTRTGGTISISGTAESDVDFTKSMEFGLIRGSLLCVGPILSRGGRVIIPSPGGCPIGERPIDMHLGVLAALGVKISNHEDSIELNAMAGLRGTTYRLPYPSVGASLNAIVAASGAEGTTILRNMAIEPEVSRALRALSIMGRNVKRIGDRDYMVSGGLEPSAKPAVVTASPDRAEMGTFLGAGLAAGGTLEITPFEKSIIECPIEIARKMGASIHECGTGISVEFPERPLGTNITADVYPGFPTDLQPVFVASLCRAQGTSRIRDTVFKNRFSYIEPLRLMGASISGPSEGEIVVRGMRFLHGAGLEGRDIRGLAALVLAAMSARGTSQIRNSEILDRGYERFVQKLAGVGASIWEVEAE